jgi:hypothetical protein
MIRTKKTRQPSSFPYKVGARWNITQRTKQTGECFPHGEQENMIKSEAKPGRAFDDQDAIEPVRGELQADMWLVSDP